MTNHVERLHGLEPKDTKCHDQEGFWSSIHGEVKEAESMKIHCGDVGSRMEQNKEGKKFYYSLFPFDYIYIYICLYIVKTKDC